MPQGLRTKELMMTSNFQNTGPITGLPSDLRALVDQSSLLNLALHTVAETDCPKSFSSASGETPLSGPMMLTLTSYAYAIGLFGSRDIESTIYKDPTLRYICARQFPRWEDIRRFRRIHRDLVQATLGSLLTSLCVYYLLPAHPQLTANIPASEIDGQIRAAAAGRIEAAIIMDAVDADI
jgi:hypothetical protein